MGVQLHFLTKDLSLKWKIMYNQLIHHVKRWDLTWDETLLCYRLYMHLNHPNKNDSHPPTLWPLLLIKLSTTSVKDLFSSYTISNPSRWDQTNATWCENLNKPPYKNLNNNHIEFHSFKSTRLYQISPLICFTFYI